MRILAASTRGAGHVGPLLPLVRACVVAGHEVLVVAPDEARRMVEDSGLSFRSIPGPSPEETGRVFAEAMSHLGRAATDPAARDAGDRIVVGQIFARLDVIAARDGMRRIFAQFRPHAVLRDPAEFSSLLMAERHGVPHLRAAISFSSGELRLLDFAREELAQRCAEDELDPNEVLGALERSAYITPLPALADDDGLDSPPTVWRYRPRADGNRPPLPDWWTNEGDPLIYVTFGSVAPTIGFYPQLYLDAISALCEIRARILVTVGNSADRSALGSLPDHVHVEPWVPQEQVMPGCAAMVGHGGFGTTVTALAAGTPQVVLPLFADQWLNADHVHRIGAGIAVHGGPPAARTLAPAVERLLNDPSFRTVAATIAQASAELAPAAQIIGRLEALAR